MTRDKLLLKPIWSIKDICDYTSFKKTKAYEIMKVAKSKYNGVVYISQSVVSRDSVLQVLKTSIERETYVANKVKDTKGGTNEKVSS